MKPIDEMSDAELAAFVQSHLSRRGIDTVLSGGACVAIYSSGKYVSEDLDLIDRRLEPMRKIREAMAEIGFTQKGRHFAHPSAKWIVELPRGPLAVGSEAIAEVEERHTSVGILRMLTPTDCVKDRLAAYYHWKDRQCLEQAVLVAEALPIDIREIERWSKVEGMLVEFRKIRDLLFPGESES